VCESEGVRRRCVSGGERKRERGKIDTEREKKKKKENE